MIQEAGIAPRIALIHALFESIAPIHAAFAERWPEARHFDLLDSALAPDLQTAGILDDDMHRRFADLGAYASSLAGAGGRTAALLFTCSAFGPAIDRVKAQLSIPVLRPNEAAFELALEMGSRIGLMVTFAPSLPALERELRDMAAARGRQIEIMPLLAEGALAALKAGDGAAHDRMAAEAATALHGVDVIVLGQFSLARAARSVSEATDARVLTTVNTAVDLLRRRLAA